MMIQTVFWMFVSLSGVVVLLLAVFWNRKGSIPERIVDAIWSWDDVKDRSPRAWWLVLGSGLIALGFYMVVRIWLP